MKLVERADKKPTTLKNNRRWIEFKFFFFCSGILKTHKRFTELKQLISALNWTNSFDSGILIDVATDMFLHRNHKPSILEATILHEEYPKTLTKAKIKRLFNCTDKGIKKCVSYIRLNNIALSTVYPRYPKEVHQNIENFFILLQTLKRNIL